MHSRTVEQVRSWDSRPFSGGLEALSSLSEADHTGVVVADDTWIFMLNGRVIGLFEGTMDDFEAEGTVYNTPHESLPLLFAMQEREGRTRAKYFTEDTPLSEADKTLADANFTGYIELSENVLSGDYYLVYYGGTRRSAAFIGQSERVETGKEAFERAADEVGLYEVKDVSMTITEIPEPAPAVTEENETDDQTEPAVASTSGDAEPADESNVAEPAEPDSATSHPDEAEAHIDEVTETTEPTTDSPAQEAPETTQSAESATETHDGKSETESPAPDPTPETAEESGHSEPTTSDQPADPNRDASAQSPSAADAAEDVSDSELEKMFRAEAEWRQTRSIPALDPDETESPDGSADSGKSSSVSTGAESQESSSAKRSGSSNTPTRRTAGKDDQGRSKPSATTSSKSDGRSSPATDKSGRKTGRSEPTQRGKALEKAVKKREARIEKLETRLADMESQRSSLESELEAERSDREELEATLETLREERDQLEARVEELEAAAAGESSSTDAETVSLTSAEAFSGTNLFVRYDSKGEPTLEALGEDVDPAAVNENLQLEHHTQFETDGARVDGEPFREFLEGTGSFRFVSWLLRELPYELLETGNRNSLSDLFEAISEIDRIEFDGSVTVDAESGTDQHFDIVMRDRMGNPLIVSEYNNDRNPVQGSELEALLEGARDVANSVESLAGAFYVTASFFEPAALENAEAAASTGGLFSRQEKASYVSPESGSGFHLGLIEDRSQAFHVTVPKL